MTVSLMKPYAGRNNQSPLDQSNRPAPVTRSTPATISSIPQGLINSLDVPEGPPPAYTENLRDPTVLTRKLTEIEQMLAAKNKGSLIISPYTQVGNIDAVRLLYRGMTQLELTARELETPTYINPNFGRLIVLNQTSFKLQS